RPHEYGARASRAVQSRFRRQYRRVRGRGPERTPPDSSRLPRTTRHRDASARRTRRRPCRGAPGGATGRTPAMTSQVMAGASGPEHGPMVVADHLVRTFRGGGGEVVAVDDASLTVPR